MLACGLAIVCLVVVAEDAAAVDRPTGEGVYSVGRMSIEFQSSCQPYNTSLVYYYPALTEGINASADPSGGPYPTVIFHPGYLSQPLDYNETLRRVASHGFVVIGFVINWRDRDPGDPLNSCCPPEVNDTLNHTEMLNGLGTSFLHGMVRTDRYGMMGHSMGGLYTLWNCIYVERICALMPLAGYFPSGEFDEFYFKGHKKPIMLQVGMSDEVEGIRGMNQYYYNNFNSVKSLVELPNIPHMGPFRTDLMVAFFRFWIGDMDEYWPLLYGSEAVREHAKDQVRLKFRWSQDHFFPPEVTASKLPRRIDMDEMIDMNVSIKGYLPWEDPAPEHGWDLDFDLVIDIPCDGSANATACMNESGTYKVVYVHRWEGIEIVSVYQMVTVYNVVPTAVATADPVVDHDSTHVLDGSNSTDSESHRGQLLYKWSFTDGHETEFSSEPEVTHTFTTLGIVTVTLTVRDPMEAESSVTCNVTVNNVPPAAEVQAKATVLEDEVVELAGLGTDTTSHQDGLEYMWDFGDGDQREWSAEGSATHAYTGNGTYTVTLTVRDPTGAEASDTQEIRVSNVAPTASIDRPIDGSEPVEGRRVRFSGVGNDTGSDRTALRYKWDFGDGTETEWLAADEVEQQHTYKEDGRMTVVLYVMDDDGEVSQSSVEIDVKAEEGGTWLLIGIAVVIVVVVLAAMLLAMRAKGRTA